MNCVCLARRIDLGGKVVASENLSWGRRIGPIPSGAKNWTWDKGVSHQSNQKLSTRQSYLTVRGPCH